ncbi:MAG: sigma-70 family RNA polymerase sigma factor [Verrucomicrobiales bacterium]|nr:sigma-70 family RNA polymerase sigma factor [Verrucomicrobiales bacterium]
MLRSIHQEEERGARFATTHWSVIVAASQPGSDHHDQALATLCHHYWLPVYAYIRRRGNRPEDAQDLAQEFFARLLAKQWLAGIEPQGSRFRSFLLTAVSRFLANEYDRSCTAKRGGGAVPWNLEEAEARCQDAFASLETPERTYDRRWAVILLNRAMGRLRDEADASGKGTHFARLNGFLSREAEPGEYDALGPALNLNSGAVAVAVHRLRTRYRQILRFEVAQTLSDPDLVDEELRHLLAALQPSTR